MKIIYATETANIPCPACRNCKDKQFSSDEKTEQLEDGDGLVVKCNDCGYQFIVINMVSTEPQEDPDSERNSLKRIADAFEEFIKLFKEVIADAKK